MRAQGQRLDFAELPRDLVADVEKALGRKILASHTAVGGFTPGAAGVCQLADGDKVFVKATSTRLSERAMQMHRREYDVLRALPEEFPAPRSIAGVNSGDWFALVTECVDGVMPEVPLDATTVSAVLGFVVELAEAGSPSPIDIVDRVGAHQAERANRWAWKKLRDERARSELDDWSSRHLEMLIDLEKNWIEAAHGESLLHRDLRTDNMLLTPAAVVAVDWPTASRGAAWVDLVGLLPSLGLEGGPDPHAVFGVHPVGRDAEPAAVDCYLAALAGYFTRQALLPPPPMAPPLRNFQARQGSVCRAWLQQRLGWE